MQTRIYQIAYVPPEETTLGADVGETDTTIELADGQDIQTSGDTYLYVGGEFMLIEGIGYEPRFVNVVRGALGTEAQSHSAGEKVFEGEIDPSGSGTDERELRHVDEINNPDIKSLGDIEQSLEYEKAKFRISNTSVSLYDLPKNRLRDAGSIYHPWVVEILDDASNIIFSGIIDGSSVTFNAESRITSFDVLSWLEIMDRAGAVPSRDIYETSIRGSRKSNSENAFFEYPGKGVQIQINDDTLPDDVATENDVGVIEGDNNEVREFVSLKKSAEEVDGDFPVVLLSTSNEGSDDRVVRRFPPSGESSKFNIDLLPTPSTSGPGVVYGFNYTDPQGVRELAEIAGTDLSDLSSGLGKKVDLPSGYSVEFELTYTFTKADDTTETVTRKEEITSLGFAMKEDGGPVVELFQGSETAGGTFIKSIEGNDGGFIRVKRDSATAIVQNLEGGDTIRFLDQTIYGYEGRILDVGSRDIFNGDYAPRELLDGLFSIEARGTDNRRRLGVLPEVFTGAYKESNRALHNIDGRAQLPSDPLKAVRQIQQKGRFLLKESFTNRTNIDGDPIPGYGVDLILRNNFFETAEEVSTRKVKSWEEDVATDTVRGVIIKPNKDYFSGRAGPDVDERIGFYFEGIEQYEDPQADDLRERMTPPEGRNVIEIEMPALPSDNIGAIYSGGDSVVENNPRLKEIARFYYEHFRKGAREVNLTFGNDDPEWLGGYYYFKNQGEVIDDYVFVLQETKNVDSTSIDTQIKGRIGADAVNVISPTPTAIIRGPQDISRADAAGNVEVVLRGEDSYSLADNPLRYKWERKPSGGSYSTAQSEGPVLQDSLSGVDSQSAYVYKLTVTDERTGKTDSVTHKLTVGPGQDSPLPGGGSDEFSVQTWQQDGKGYLEIYPVSRVGLDFVRARKKVGGNIESGQSFNEVSQLSISPQSVDTTANSVVLADDYEEHFANKPRVYFQRSNGSYSAFDLSSVSYDSSADETTLSLAESISSTDVANVLSGAYIVTVGLTDKHTSTIEVQTRGVLTEKRQTITKTFDFNNLAEVDASVYNDESGAVYADVSGDEDTDTFDLEYRINGGSWQTVLTGQATDIIGYEVVQADSVTDGDNVEVRITPYNSADEQGQVVLRATFYNRSQDGGAQYDGVTINGAGTIDSVNTGEFRFRDADGNDDVKIDVFNVDLRQLNGLDISNYVRSDQSVTFGANVTIEEDLLVKGDEVIQNVETVEAQDNLLFLNAGESGNGVLTDEVGFEGDRGSAPPIKLKFDENTFTGRIGVDYKAISHTGANFTFNETIVGQSSGAEGIVWQDGNGTARIKGRTGTFSSGETIVGQQSGASATINSVSRIDQTEALVTREDATVAGGITYWNGSKARLEMTQNLVYKESENNGFYSGNEVQTKAGIGHPDYTAELEHWYITPGGLGDFRTLLADELRVEAFIAEVEEALAGSDFLTKSFATLDEAFDVPSSSPVGTQKDLTVQDLDGLGATPVFSNNTSEEDDTLRLRITDRSGEGLTVADIWLRCLAGSYTDNGDGTQTWTVEILQAGDAGIGAGLTAPEGSVVLDYGVPGDFLIERSVLNPDSGDIAPYDRMLSWKDNDGDRIPDDYEVLNLRGRLDGLSKAYASGFGTYTETARFTSDIIVGDIEAGAAGDQTGSYLRFSDNTGLEVVYGDGFDGTGDGRLSSAVLQLEDDVRLLAEEIVQEKESRAGLEITTSETEAEVRAQAEVIGDDGLFSASTLSLFASRTESRFDADVKFKDEGSVVSSAALSMVAREDGSSIRLTGDSIYLDGDTEVNGQFTVNDTNIDEDYTFNTEVAAVFRQSETPDDQDAKNKLSRPLQSDDIWIDTGEGGRVKQYDGTSWVASRDDDTTNQLFRKDNEPVDSDASRGNLIDGDVWIDTDGGNVAYIYDGDQSKWRRSESANYTFRKPSPAPDDSYAQNQIGRDLLEGDTWIQTDNGDKTYTYNGSEFVNTEANLRTQVDNNEANIDLIAQRLTQEREARAGLELTASETEARFEADVKFAGNTAAISLLANDDGSSARLAGDSVTLDGDTIITGSLTMDNTNDPNGEITNSAGDFTLDENGLSLEYGDKDANKVSFSNSGTEKFGMYLFSGIYGDTLQLEAKNGAGIHLESNNSGISIEGEEISLTPTDGIGAVNFGSFDELQVRTQYSDGGNTSQSHMAIVFDSNDDTLFDPTVYTEHPKPLAGEGIIYLYNNGGGDIELYAATTNTDGNNWNKNKIAGG